MANTAGTTELKLPENDKQLLEEASRHAADVQAAMSSLETHLRDASKLLAAVERINSVFSTVADRLGNATFKASIDTTHGKSAREMAVAFVKELSDLACLSFQGTRDLRRELTTAKSSAATVLPALRQAATAMQSLSGALKLLASRPAPAPAALKPRAGIVVENRVDARVATPLLSSGNASTSSTSASSSERATSTTMGFFPSGRAGRYTN